MKAIIATDEEFGIGLEGKLPWHLPADLRYFYLKTKNSIVIMGNNTWKSLPEKVRPLPDRENVVVASGYNQFMHEGAMAVFGAQFDKVIFDENFGMEVPDIPVTEPLYKRVDELCSATAMASAFTGGNTIEEIWVIGGASIYEQLLPYCDEVHWTRVPGKHGCDTHFNPSDYMADDMKVAETTDLLDDNGDVVAVVEVWRA